MAQNIGEAQINLSVNTSQMEREVSAALKRLESRGFNLGQGINSRAFTQPLGRITGAANEFQKSLDASNARVIAFGASAGAIYSVQRAFTALISSTIEVQKSLTDINVILNAGTKTLSQFGDQLFEIAKNSGQTFATVATAAGELARQGLTLEQTLKRTSDALILARLSGLDAASSVEALTASINSFNQSALDSTQIVNKLASVDAAFAVSSADLAEALKRVGSSAQDVGVSFDELLAIVASVNQTTARGGAVIGNSLKTIFTRVQRTDVLDQLEALGIAVRDLNGNTAPAIQILTGLAQKFDQLGDAQRSQLAELVGGVFQINVLKAALGDLSKEYSIYGNALKTATNASDEAIRRNEELNKTLAALLNKTLANLTKVGSEIGALSFQPAIEKVLGGLNTALESFDVKGDSIGSKIGKGIFEGIGSFISGPGLALLIGVFGKIFLNLAKFTTDAVKTVLGLNREAQTQAQLQERINSILAQNPALVQNILNKQVSLLQVEKDILTIIQAQTQARQQSTAIATTLTRGLISKGVTSEKGVIRSKSRGFIPNFSTNKEIMGAISGGYMPGQVRSMNIPNYGRVIYNDAETVKKFSGLKQPGIMPPEGSDAGKNYKQKFKDKYGIDPYASSGFIPNFAGRPATNSQIASMIDQGYVRVTGNELKSYLKGAGGVLDPKKAIQFGAITRYDETWVPERKFNKLVYSSKADLESIAKKKGGVFEDKGGVPLDYALVYPGFQESNRFPTKGKTSRGKNIGFYAVPFPGQLKNKKNALVGPGVYGNAINALVDSSASFLTGLAGVSPSVVNSSKFKRYLKSNITQDQLGTLVGNVFEGGILAALEIAPSDRTRVLDLTAGELQKVGQTFKISSLSAGDFLGGDFKNSLSVGNRNSMADKIVNSGMRKALGFIPNFSPIEKALKTENRMGGKGVLDYQQGVGLYVRDGKTQPNFAAVMKDHPEGIQNAIQNSRQMQKLVSNGFIPNFAPAGFDPMTLFFTMQSFMGMGQNDMSEAVMKEERNKLAQILRERRAAQQLLAQAEKAEIKDQKLITTLTNEKAEFEAAESRQRSSMQNQMGVLARNPRGRIVGGFGGAAGRFAGRYGTGIALAAPLLTGIASEFVGDDVTRGGRATKAGVTGLGSIASYAGIGAMIGSAIPGLGTGAGALIGGGLGAISATTNAIKEFNDIMPELKAKAEKAQEGLNNVNAATQLLSTSLETLSSIQNNTSLSSEQRVRLQEKATEDLANSIAKLNEALPGSAAEIENLYRKVGDTAELRTKISELQAEAQKSSQAILSGTRAVASSKKFEDLVGPGFFEGFYGLLGETETVQERYKGLKPSERAQLNQDITSGAESISGLFNNLSNTERNIQSSKIQELVTTFNSKGLTGLKDLISGLVKNGEDAAYITEILNEINPDALERYFNKWLELQKSAERTEKLIADTNAKFARGEVPITRIEDLQRQFALPGGITPAALGRIDFNKMEQNLSGQKNLNFAEQFATGYRELSDSLGYGADRIKYLSEYTQQAAEIQKDWNNGAISTTQAFERLKIAIDKVNFEKNAPFMFSGERAQARQGILERQLKQGKFAEGLDPLNSFFDRFGDNAATTADKINKSFGNLAENLQTGFEDAFGAFVDGTKTADQAFKDMLLSISQQIIKEQFSIGMRSLLGAFTGGGGFGSTGGGNTGGFLGGIFNSIFGGKAKGGIIKKYSGGGYVDGGSGVKDDVPAMLTDGEYVLRKSAVNKYGINALNMLNQGGMIKGYAGGGGIEGRGYQPRPGERTMSAYINSIFSRGRDVSSYLNDRFLQANNNMVYRGGKGGDMLSKPVPFERRLSQGDAVGRLAGLEGKIIKGEALHSTPMFKQAAGYAGTSLNISFRNIAGKQFSVSSSTTDLPLASRADMVQSFYNLGDSLVMRPGPGGGSVYTQAMGMDVFGIKLKDYINAQVSDTVLNNLSPEERRLTSMTYTDGLELEAKGGRKGQAFLVRRYGDEAVRLPAPARKRINQEIKMGKISQPSYMPKPQRGAYLDSQILAKSARGLGPTSTFFDDLDMARSYSGIGQTTLGPKPNLASTMAPSLMQTAAKPSLLSRGLSLTKGLAGGLFQGLAYGPATEFLNPSSLGPIQGTLPYQLETGQISMKQFGLLSNIEKSDRAIFNAMNRRSAGGRIKGYATGGSINALLANTYDFYGAAGEKLNEYYMPEAFKTTVNAPGELSNVPALTGRFNISDLLSSRSLMDENNPMNALRTQRFLGMQSYQEQAANFKTGYNEQYRQVEEQRKEAQRLADEENARRRAAYNQQRMGTLIGGLLSVGFSAISPFLGGMGGGGGGILGGIQNIAQNVVSGIFSGAGQSGGSQTMSAYQKEMIAKQNEQAITSYQNYGFNDFRKQANLFPQFGNQGGFGGGFGGGMGGSNFAPTSSIGGFQFGVGLGAPAGFQTYFQNAQQDYLLNFASPVAPIAPGRSNLVYDFLNQNTNPFGYSRGYAKGGLIRGYQDGGIANQYLPSNALNLLVKGSDGKTYTLAQMGLTTNNTYADLERMGGQAFGGGYNNPELIYLLNEMQSGLGSQFNRVTGINDLFHMKKRAPGTSHRTGYKADFTLNDYKNGKENIINFLKGRGLKQGQDYALTYEGPGTPGSTGTHFDFKLNKTGVAKVAAMMSGMPVENIAMMQTNRPVIAGGIPSRTDLPNYLDLPLSPSASFPGASTNNIAGTNISTIGPQANPFTRINPITRALTPDGPSRSNRPYIGSRGSPVGSLMNPNKPTGIPSPFSSRGVLPSMGNRGVLPANPIQPQTGDFPTRGVLPSMGNRGVLPATQIPDISNPYFGPTRSPIMYDMGENITTAPKTVQPSQPPMGPSARATTQNFAKKVSEYFRDPLGILPSGGGLGKGAIPTIFPGRGNIPTIESPANLPSAAQKNGLPSSQVNVPGANQTPLDLSDPIIAEYVKSQSQLFEEAAQNSMMQLPYFRDLRNMVDMATGNAPTLYQSIGSLYDVKNKGDYGKLAARFSSFYGNDFKNRYSSFGERGFNNYLNYIGASPFSSLSQFNAFKFPMTPNMYSPFAFGSRYFGGFGGTGYQSGFNSLGTPFSNWFSTGSRLGITPSWASRATGGMIYGGTSYKDDVPAMLMGGEYVIRKDVVDRMGEPFFNRLNRGQAQGFAEGGPVGTNLPSVGMGQNTQQDNSRNQFVESITKLVKSLEQLNKGIEEQNREGKNQAEKTADSSEAAGGVTNNININVNVDQNGKTTDSTTQQDQNSGTDQETDQEKFKKTMERSRVLAELLRQQILKVLVEEQRPGGVLYQGTKGRDLGR